MLSSKIENATAYERELAKPRSMGWKRGQTPTVGLVGVFVCEGENLIKFFARIVIKLVVAHFPCDEMVRRGGGV